MEVEVREVREVREDLVVRWHYPSFGCKNKIFIEILQ